MKHPFSFWKAAHAPTVVAFFLLYLIALGIPQASLSQTSNMRVEGGSPRTLTYQGVISNGDSPISDGIHVVSVTLYTDATGTTSIWSSTYTPQLSNGVFNVVLGSDKPLPEAPAMDRP